MREAIAIVVGLAVLGAVNWGIHGREQLLAEGRVVLLELAPVDPRSLMQGDYMALRFKIADDAFGRGRSKESEDGRVVVKLDPRNVATYVRRDDGNALAEGEAVLRYRVRDGEVKFATNAYFFQEGHARYYERARYGEFRVAPDGETILTAMRGEKLEILGPPR
ncbi:MAG TPA: GDYXXLXY domain-containing protein [Burkholderiales bacterium]|nr:GDYXXLXY domain-containing protein [Burkholderiales bacterium]